ncbi:MAG: hypothetical protein K2N87_00230 [Eubacterium sp.]|nr:hypothetical protein [Eubacterium sp.]
MEQVRKFDEELKCICQDAFFMGKFAGGLLCCLGMMFMLFPFEMAKKSEMLQTMLPGFLCCVNGVCTWLRPYLSIREGDRTVSIYKKLEFMPVTKAEIRKVRYGYLHRFCIRLGAAAFLMQQAVSVLNHSFGAASMLFAAAWTAAVWLAGWFYIYWRRK